jgi:hypothetical protein
LTLSRREGFGGGSGSGAPDVRFNAATQTYTFFGYAGSSLQQVSFDPSSLTTTTSQFVNYSFVDSTGNTQALRLLNPAAGNPQIELTYASYGIRTFTGATVQRSGRSDQEFGYYLMGLPTAYSARPRTGTATYAGVAEGSFGSDNTRYALTGTSTLTADFVGQTISTTLSLSGVDAFNNSTINLGQFAGTSNIVNFFGSGNAGFQGLLTNAGNSLFSGEFSGVFFGPSAAEYGYSFNLREENAAGQTVNVGAGITVGKKN